MVILLSKVMLSSICKEELRFSPQMCENNSEESIEGASLKNKLSGGIVATFT